MYLRNSGAWSVRGEVYLQTEAPIGPSSLRRWRKRIGEEGVETLRWRAHPALGQKRGITRALQSMIVGPAPSEPVMGHMKMEGCPGLNPLEGALGDARHAVIDLRALDPFMRVLRHAPNLRGGLDGRPRRSRSRSQARAFRTKMCNLEFTKLRFLQ